MKDLRQLILGMRAAFARGENAMAFAREKLADESDGGNLSVATLIAYDLQAGSYIERVRRQPEVKKLQCNLIAKILKPLLSQDATLVNVGVGEATTLTGVLSYFSPSMVKAYGFDLSWSRVSKGNLWLNHNGQAAELFVGDLFHIPFCDHSIDVVFSTHSLEPNGGREEQAIAECLRVARKAVVLIEPLYEFASEAGRDRMNAHGYVRGLRKAAERLGAEVKEERLLESCANPLNPSGVVILDHPDFNQVEESRIQSIWQCPLTASPLEQREDFFFAKEAGIAYPNLKGIPLLRPEHAVFASSLGNS